ncbi:hypothetical protein ACA910_008089 [Epithemia clementina (nom. ined.)]
MGGRRFDSVRTQTLEAFRRASRKLFRTYPTLREEIDKIQYKIMGYFPKLGIKTGYQYMKRHPLQYYDEIDNPTRILDVARKIDRPLSTPQQERRQLKLIQLRRKGKGPPKKGAGRKAKVSKN